MLFPVLLRCSLCGERKVDLAVLAGHIPFITSVCPGECKIELEDGTDRIGITDGGLLTVSAEKTTLLSGSFRWKEEIK